MSQKATKAANSVFYLARMAASERNDRLSSRERAAEELGIDRTRLARIELGSINPYPEEAQIMADEYGAPELMNYYCSRCCPIGRTQTRPCKTPEFDRMMLQAVGVLREAGKITDAILTVAEDGRVDPSEAAAMRQIFEYLQSVGTVADEMRLWIKKHMKK